MENGLLYVLAFSAMAIALFACVLPQASNLEIPKGAYVYQIFNDGIDCVAEDSDGVEIYRSTNQTYVFESAQNALTADRTWVEGIYVQGYFDGISNASIKSYTRWFGEAKFKLASDSTVAVFRQTTELRSLSFEGLSFEGSGGGYAIWLLSPSGAGTYHSAYDIEINSCNFTNFYSCIQANTYDSVYAQNIFTNCSIGLDLQAGQRNKIFSNSFMVDKTGTDFIGARICDVSGFVVSDNYFYGYGTDGTYSKQSSGVRVQTSYDGIINNNVFQGLQMVGVAVDIDNRPSGSTRISIQNNVFDAVGIDVSSASKDGCIAIGTYSTSTACSGIVITGNNAYNCHNLLGVGSNGQNTANVVVCKNNYIKTCYRMLVLYGTAFDVEFSYNTVIGNTSASIVQGGTFTCTGNRGYP